MVVFVGLPAKPHICSVWQLRFVGEKGELITVMPACEHMGGWADVLSLRGGVVMTFIKPQLVRPSTICTTGDQARYRSGVR